MLPQWTEVTREFVSSQQSKAYARAARSLGLGHSAEKGYAALAVPPRPPLRSLPEEAASEMGLTAEERQQFDELAARKDAEYRAREIPTQFEDSTMYPSLAMTFDETYRRLEERGFGVDPVPLFATTALGNVNAMMMREPETNTPIIFFDQGLFRFVYGFCLVAAWALPPLSRQQLSSDEALAALAPTHGMPAQASASFTDVFRRFVFAGMGRTAEARLPYPEHNRLAGMSLMSLMEYFVMGHELAHIILGHTQDAASPKGAWQQEYDADTVGVALVTAMSREILGSGAFGLWAAQMVLTGFNLLYRALAVAEHGDRKVSWISPTHPDPLTRRQHLRENPDIPPATVAAADTLRAMSDAVFQRLWEFAVMELMLDRNNGRQPFALWKQHTSTSIAAS